MPKKSSPHQKVRTPFRTRVTAIIESSGLVRGRHHQLPRQPQQPSPPATAPLAKRVLAPVLASSSSESVAAVVVSPSGLREPEPEELRKTSSLTALLTPRQAPPDLSRRSVLEDRLSSSGQMSLVLKLQTKLVESKESSVCSSVLSSMESVESNTSEGEEQELFITAGTRPSRDYRIK